MTICAARGRIHLMRLLPKAFLVGALTALMCAAPAFAQQGHFGVSPEMVFKVLGNTPQMLAENPNLNYLAGDKFPDYMPRMGFTFKTSVNRREWSVGEKLDLIFEAGRKGYVTIVDYSPDGIATVLLRNKPVSPGFCYAFTGDLSEPSGEDYLRAVLSTAMLNYESLQALCEFPCAAEVKTDYVISEKWLTVSVRTSRVRTFRYYDDPFYAYPRRWYHSLGNDIYIYAQPSVGTIIARGLNAQTGSLVYTDYTEYGPAQYWLLQPGGRMDVSFDASGFPFETRSVYLLLYMSSDNGTNSIFTNPEEPNLRIYLNGGTVTEEYRPRYNSYYDDNPPEVITLHTFTRYGANNIELQLDAFSGASVRLRRIEVRTNLDAFSAEYIWPDSSGFF